MKFEHVLQIYWSKGLLINGRLQPFTSDFNSMFHLSGGFSWSTKWALIRRFELYTLVRKPNQSLSHFGKHFTMGLNILFSQITSVNNPVFDITRYNLLRLYLIRTTRGRSHALGKPSRGQRTWSNAWNAYSTNNVTRSFINAYQRMQRKNVKEEKINYKLIKKKSFRKKKKEAVSKIVVRVNNWF